MKRHGMAEALMMHVVRGRGGAESVDGPSLVYI